MSESTVTYPMKTRDLVNYICDTYYLPKDKYFRDKLRKQIRKCCSNIKIPHLNIIKVNGEDTLDSLPKDDELPSLWEITAPQSMAGKSNKNRDHEFTEGQTKLLFNDQDFLEYLEKAIPNESKLISSRKINHAKMEQKLEQLQKHLENVKLVNEANRTYEPYMPSEKNYMEISNDRRFKEIIDDALKLKIELMIEALFRKFYEPIDPEEIEQDMYVVSITPPDDLTLEYIQAHKKLSNPIKAYVKELKTK